MAETSTKPYLIRAIHEWCTDNGYTPYVAVAVDQRTTVPMEHVRNGEIVLNVSPLATNHLHLGNDLIEFQARFGGVPRELSIPVENVTAIYARENGHGMAFDVPKAPAVEAVPGVDAPPVKEVDPVNEIGDAVLASVTPTASAGAPAASSPGASSKSPPQLVSVGNDSSSGGAKADRGAGGSKANSSDDPEPPEPPPAKPRQSRPKLTRIK